MVTAGATGGPGVGLALGASAQGGAVEFVEAGRLQAQFGGGGAGVEMLGAMFGQQVANEGGGQAVAEL